MSEMEQWLKDGAENGWQMPTAPRWKRLPIIRHLRAIYWHNKVERHYRMCAALGMVGRTGYDEWVVYGIWHGMEGGE